MPVFCCLKQQETGDSTTLGRGFPCLPQHGDGPRPSIKTSCLLLGCFQLRTMQPTTHLALAFEPYVASTCLAHRGRGHALNIDSTPCSSPGELSLSKRVRLSGHWARQVAQTQICELPTPPELKALGRLQINNNEAQPVRGTRNDYFILMLLNYLVFLCACAAQTTVSARRCLSSHTAVSPHKGSAGGIHGLADGARDGRKAENWSLDNPSTPK